MGETAPSTGEILWKLDLLGTRSPGEGLLNPPCLICRRDGGAGGAKTVVPVAASQLRSPGYRVWRQHCGRVSLRLVLLLLTPSPL